MRNLIAFATALLISMSAFAGGGHHNGYHNGWQHNHYNYYNPAAAVMFGAAIGYGMSYNRPPVIVYQAPIYYEQVVPVYEQRWVWDNYRQEWQLQVIRIR